MKTTLSNLFIASVLLLALTGFTNALTVSSNSLTFSEGTTSQSFTVTGFASSALTIPSLVTITGDSGYSVDFNVIKTGDPAVITITPTASIDFSKFAFGKTTYSGNILVSNSSNPVDSSTVKLNIKKQEYCTVSDNGNLEITDVNIKTVSGFGDDENYWYPMDEVEIEVTVDNNGADNVNNIKIDWALYTTEGKRITHDSVSDFDLKEGKSVRKPFTFKVDADQLDSGTEDYVLYIKATGDDKETDTSTCNSYSQDIEIRIESDLVILDNLQIAPETAQCGDEVTVTADVWNIGDNDQNNVYVVVYNPQLGLNNLKVNIGDINSFEKESLNLPIKIPANASEKDQIIEFRVYDDSNDIYQTSEDDNSVFTSHVLVSGNCGVITNKAVVSASLESGGKAGSNAVIKATITNTGDTSATFTLSATDYSDWASDVQLDKTTLLLKSGEFQDVLLTLKVNSGVSGEKTFNIELSSDGKLAVKQPVSIPIQSSGFSITGGFINDSNWYLWGIGFVNVILVIIIIIVAIRVAKG